MNIKYRQVVQEIPYTEIEFVDDIELCGHALDIFKGVFGLFDFYIGNRLCLNNPYEYTNDKGIKKVYGEYNNHYFQIPLDAVKYV